MQEVIQDDGPVRLSGTAPEPAFKIGDVVMLKSGGPAMTVTNGPDDKGSIGCTWISHDTVLGDRFDARTVMTVPSGLSPENTVLVPVVPPKPDKRRLP